MLGEWCNPNCIWVLFAEVAAIILIVIVVSVFVFEWLDNG
jgi:hypothetical protein